MSDKTAGVIALLLILAINVVLAYAPPDIEKGIEKNETFISENRTTNRSSTTTNETTVVQNGSSVQSTTRKNQSEQEETEEVTKRIYREVIKTIQKDYKSIVNIASAFLGLFIVYDMFRPRKPPEPPKKKEEKEEPTKTVINVEGDYISGNGSTVDKRETNVQQGGKVVFGDDQSETKVDVQISAGERKSEGKNAEIWMQRSVENTKTGDSAAVAIEKNNHLMHLKESAERRDVNDTRKNVRVVIDDFKGEMHTDAGREAIKELEGQLEILEDCFRRGDTEMLESTKKRIVSSCEIINEVWRRDTVLKGKGE